MVPTGYDTPLVIDTDPYTNLFTHLFTTLPIPTLVLEPMPCFSNPVGGLARRPSRVCHHSTFQHRGPLSPQPLQWSPVKLVLRRGQHWSGSRYIQPSRLSGHLPRQPSFVHHRISGTLFLIPVDIAQRTTSTWHHWFFSLLDFLTS